MPHDNAPLAEVISSSITGVVAQCLMSSDKDGMPDTPKPRFGSFLKIRTVSNLDVLTVVHNVITGSPDAVHQPWALGLSREQLREEQPHIFSLLRTEVHAVVVGYIESGGVFQHLPPVPPEVHDFVYLASDEEIRQVTEGFDFLRLIATVTTVPQDELAAASIREAHKAHGNDYSFLVEAGQALSHIFKNDFDRLVTILRKIRPGTPARS
ncbi:MAG: hypothetical protein DKT66_17015 [Candidatus Melainabacteria bacterium]|nr:MAG: hypothetical protein DKT66_17015 [Candidatus Melainabacteria bacterium]